jgi:hypothetical protein
VDHGVRRIVGGRRIAVVTGSGAPTAATTPPPGRALSTGSLLVGGPFLGVRVGSGLLNVLGGLAGRRLVVVLAVGAGRLAATTTAAPVAEPVVVSRAAQSRTGTSVQIARTGRAASASPPRRLSSPAATPAQAASRQGKRARRRLRSRYHIRNSKTPSV